MAKFKFNLRNENYFPTFDELPDDNDIDLRYYSDPGNYGVCGPIKHWCLLVEIVEPIPYLRPMFKVKDKAGKQFLIALYLDNGVELPSIWKKHCFPGAVIAIMYATKHFFLDGQQGIRMEELENIKMIPCSLDTLLRIGDDLQRPPAEGKCGNCKSPASLRCSKCSAIKYCGADCQLRDWKARHKFECVAFQKVVEWKGKNWNRFTSYWMDQ